MNTRNDGEKIERAARASLATVDDSPAAALGLWLPTAADRFGTLVAIVIFVTALIAGAAMIVNGG